MRLALTACSLVVSIACARDNLSAPSVPAPAPMPVALSGHVYDTLSRAVAGARVEVLDGPQSGGPTTTDSDGAFTVTAALNVSRLRATKDGYEPAVVPLLQRAPISFYLAAVGTVKLAGPYTLTVEADPACVNLPAAARTRTYDAFISPDAAASLRATLDGPGLHDYFRFVLLRAGGDTVDFDLSDNGIVQEIADETYFSIGGVGSASGATASRVSAPFNGTIDYCEVKPGTESFWPCAGPVVTREQCHSSNHRMTLTSR